MGHAVGTGTAWCDGCTLVRWTHWCDVVGECCWDEHTLEWCDVMGTRWCEGHTDVV